MRLDQHLVETGLADTRSKARGLILAGQVRVNGEVVTKAGHNVGENARVELEAPMPYVSRGGLKLAGALDHFGLEAVGLKDAAQSIALDIGVSTGGFTDCLLQRGVPKIFAVDVGYGQLAWKLRSDPRVVLHERVNIRQLAPETLDDKVDLIVIDVSFISILKFLERLPLFLKPDGRVLAMVKPQFEGRREQVGKGGVIRDRAVIDAILANFTTEADRLGFEILGRFDSTIKGAEGNQEIFCLMRVAATSRTLPNQA